MIGQMAIAIAFSGFNDLGRTVTPVILLMGHFSAFSEKIEENLSTRSLSFFTKCTIEFRSFQLFVHRCDGFKCLLKD